MAVDNREIARYNERITVQKNETVTDKLRNRSCVWKDYYPCWAYCSTYQYDEEGGSENSKATTKPEQTITFEVRWCEELKNIDSTHYRVVFNGDIYNIISVDGMNHQKKKIRFRSKLEKQAVKS